MRSRKRKKKKEGEEKKKLKRKEYLDKGKTRTQKRNEKLTKEVKRRVTSLPNHDDIEYYQNLQYHTDEIKHGQKPYFINFLHMSC